MKKTHKIVIGIISVISLVLILSIVSIGLSVRSFLFTSFPTQADQQFGDQNLKTALALIELHKVRFGSYPDTLDDLQYMGEWDQMAINSVLYIPNADHTRYYLEVERGWVGKPSLTIPDEFWQGTGYDPSLKPDK